MTPPQLIGPASMPAGAFFSQFRVLASDLLGAGRSVPWPVAARGPDLWLEDCYWPAASELESFSSVTEQRAKWRPI